MAPAIENSVVLGWSDSRLTSTAGSMKSLRRLVFLETKHGTATVFSTIKAVGIRTTFSQTLAFSQLAMAVFLLLGFSLRARTDYRSVRNHVRFWKQ